jgi:hypothetical protein
MNSGESSSPSGRRTFSTRSLWGTPMDEFESFRPDIEAMSMRSLDLAPEYAKRVRMIDPKLFFNPQNLQVVLSSAT